MNKDKIICPTCGKKNTWHNDNPHRPFCSDRCKLIDLGDWAAEKFRIQTDESNSTEDSDDEKNG